MINPYCGIDEGERAVKDFKELHKGETCSGTCGLSVEEINQLMFVDDKTTKIICGPCILQNPEKYPLWISLARRDMPINSSTQN